jgi:hypothetical protein
MRPSVQQPNSKDKNVMARARKYYLKNNYLTLRSKVKVPQRSLWYATHHLMVMHPHTKYHWPISKDKNVMAQRRKYYLKNNFWPWGQRSRSHEGYYGTWHTTLWSCTHIPNIIDLSGKTKKLWAGQASLRRCRRRRGSGSGRHNSLIYLHLMGIMNIHEYIIVVYSHLPTCTSHMILQIYQMNKMHENII